MAEKTGQSQQHINIWQSFSAGSSAFPPHKRSFEITQVVLEPMKTYTGTQMQACSTAVQKEKQQPLNPDLPVSEPTCRRLDCCPSLRLSRILSYLRLSRIRETGKPREHYCCPQRRQQHLDSGWGQRGNRGARLA